MIDISFEFSGPGKKTMVAGYFPGEKAFHDVYFSFLRIFKDYFFDGARGGLLYPADFYLVLS